MLDPSLANVSVPVAIPGEVERDAAAPKKALEAVIIQKALDRDNYDFLREITKEERSDLSKVVRDMVTRGRILLAMERYKKGEASLGRAAELAGVPLGQMMTMLTGYCFNSPAFFGLA